MITSGGNRNPAKLDLGAGAARRPGISPAFQTVRGTQAMGDGTARYRIAAQLGVAWWTVMDQVIDRGTPLIEDPARLDPPLGDRSRHRCARSGRRDHIPARHRPAPDLSIWRCSPPASPT